MALTKVSRGLLTTSIVDNGNATAITIDASENVGIGRTPRVMLDVAGEAAIAYNATYGLRFYNQPQNNWSFIGNDVTGSGSDLRFGDSTGEVMRISGSNVGIGTSSPTVGKLQVNDGSGAIVAITRTSGATSGNLGVIRFGNTDIDSNLANITAIQDGSTTSSALTFETQSTGGATAERLRIASDGSISIPNQNAINELTFTGTEFTNVVSATTSGFQFGTTGAGYLAFLTNNSEQARIDNNGRLCVNTPSHIALGRVSIAAGLYNTDIGMVIQNTNTTYGSNTSFIDFRNSANSIAGRISHTGGTTVNYVTSSDERLKTNIQDADDAGDLIDSIQVRKFDWIADGTHQDYGMVAQELNLIAPLAAPSSADPEEMMGVDYSKLVPMLIKEIQSLRTRVQELENN